MNTNRSKPSLDDARARISRAKEHIATIEKEIAAVAPPNQTVARLAMGSGFISRQTEHIAAPPIVSILIGETIYNLRAALDYLIYELFHLDTGKTKNDTKFPIEDSPKAWNEYFPRAGISGRKKRKLWLHKLTADHQATLKRLQPCYGCKWTKTLRNLSNPDKHRRLVTVLASISNMGHGAIAGPSAVMVNIQLTAEVAFEDSSLIVETLQELQKQVADVIQAFDPDFK